MVRITDILAQRQPVFSFEFFPPKTDEGHRTLERTIALLKEDEPDDSRSPTAPEPELERRAENSDAVMELGVAYPTLQCSQLLAGGAPGIHFYTLNRSPATRAILAALRAAGAVGG